jgi:hypothetical protein
MRFPLGAFVLLASGAAAVMVSRERAPVQNAKIASHCDGPQYRQFDFFIGDWDAYDVADSTKIVARNHVSRMLDGCAIREVYSQTDGMSGESFSTYDASRRVWHQSWVTNRGELLLMDGGLQGRNMVFTGAMKGSNGASSLIRGTWIPLHGSVRETGVTSTDSGRTWKPEFDIIFRPHR